MKGASALAVVLLLAVGVSAAERRYLAGGVYEEGEQLVLEAPGGAVRVEVAGEEVRPPLGRLLALSRSGTEATAVRLVDRTGREVGTASIPADRAWAATDQGIITAPKSRHRPEVPHDLGFHALDGTLRAEVREPALRLARWWPQPNGRLVTANLGPGPNDRTVVVYRDDGERLWTYQWVADPKAGVPDVVITPDGRRLVLLDYRLASEPGEPMETELTVLTPGNRVLARHRLPALSHMLPSADSRRVAAVGLGTIVMLEARSGVLRWRTDEPVDLVLPGGVEFDALGKYLFVLGAERPRKDGMARVRLRRLRTSDGTIKRAEVGQWPLDRLPTVRDVGVEPSGDWRVVVHDRILRVPRLRKAR